MDVVVAITFADVPGVDVDVMVLDDVWFEWLLYGMYMYLQSLPRLSFGWPPVVLCHILKNCFLAFQDAFVSGFPYPVNEGLILPEVTPSTTRVNCSIQVSLCRPLNSIALLIIPKTFI